MKKILLLLCLVVSLATSAQTTGQIVIAKTFRVGDAGTFKGSKVLDFGADTLRQDLIPSIRSTMKAINLRNAELFNLIMGSALTTREATATLDFPSTASGSSSDLTITVTGAVVGRPTALYFGGSLVSGSYYGCRVSAPNTVTVTFLNFSGSGFDPSSGSFTVIVF